MKYNKELTDLLSNCYLHQKMGVQGCCTALGAELRKTDPTAQDPPQKSVIAKLSTLGIYQKKQYLTKRGEIPVRKSEYIEKIAKILEVDVESLESCEKLTKSVLILLVNALTPPDPSLDKEDAKGEDLSE